MWVFIFLMTTVTAQAQSSESIESKRESASVVVKPDAMTSEALQRILGEVADESKPEAASGRYDRVHNRHNR